jgi:hypothetical protein
LFYTWSWFFWALLLFLLGRKHPKMYDATPLSRGRVQLGILAAAIFIVSFSPTPVDTD